MRNFLWRTLYKHRQMVPQPYHRKTNKNNHSSTDIRLLLLQALYLYIFFVAHFIPAILLYCIIAAGCNSYAVVSILILCQGFNGAIVIGHIGNVQDLAPNFAGTIFSIMNFVGGITGFVVPMISAKFMAIYVKNNFFFQLFLPKVL